MAYWVNATITPKAAARLLISNEIDLSGTWDLSTSENIVTALIDLSIEEILHMIDCHPYGEIADYKYIPQFGKIDTIIRVPHYFKHEGKTCADYPQMGFYLKHDVNASLGANTKFGENYGKAAALLGIARCINKRFIPSSLTRYFCSLQQDKQIEVIRKLMFRIPIIQILLSNSKTEPVNGFAPMSQLKPSTMQRRSQCIRTIFSELETFDNLDLSSRIRNILWINS